MNPARIVTLLFLIGCGRPVVEPRSALLRVQAPPRTLPPPVVGTSQVLPAFDGAAAVAVSDLNRDGLLDVIVPGHTVLQVFYGLGGRTFERAELPLSAEAHAVAVADLDRDGWPDVVLAHVFTDQVTVLHGSAEGLRSPRQFATGRGPTSVVLGDVDGDGLLDLVVGNGSDDVVTLLRAPDFASVAVDGFKQPASPVLADLDGDGALDLCAQTLTGLIVRHNDGSGRFSAPRPIALGRSLGALIAADLDGEGTLDLAAVTWAGGPMALVLHGAQGERTRDLAVGVEPRDVEPADVDGDGLTDLVVAERGGKVRVLFNDGHAGFERRLTVETGDEPAEVAVGDLDGDGAMDLISVDLNRAQVFWGTREGQAAASTCAPRGAACEPGLRCCTGGACVSARCL